ncbi:hypothetical protein [Planosporangium mesophilum]|uniref:Peptidase M23 n=1 Tax=Planosporangium mesophilum TaxID=689768 RepID=A0A8J3X654_9ACTN|nr:hypothetical protein [Planosporangium mesophilum]NJC83701.1 hypothetical protein [Planosporangium mesophilum]GII25368.1 hypothetical protein Pme01_49650 [Planosporangium mesophilum]
MHHDDDEPKPDRRGSYRGSHARRSALRPWFSALLTAIAVLALGVLTINTLVRPTERAAASDATPVVLDASARAAADRATRDLERPDPSAGPLSPSAAASPLPAAAPPRPPQPVKRKPVAGLTQAEMDNAVAVIEAGKRMNVPKRAHVVAIVTALQESRLRNLANSRVPQSLNLPHQGVGSNFDSVGLFQQRPSQGWGTPAELMNPGIAAGRFYGRLVTVSGWETMSVGAAAQAVQRSAFPDAYDQHQSRAQQIVNAIA